MILIGQYDSPFVRRVAISRRVLGFSHEHDERSVFADFDAMGVGRVVAMGICLCVRRDKDAELARVVLACLALLAVCG